jgi:hypothetical protein
MPKKTEETHVVPTFSPETTPDQAIEWLLSHGYETTSALAFAKAERSWTLADTPERQFWIDVTEGLLKREVQK